MEERQRGLPWFVLVWARCVEQVAATEVLGGVGVRRGGTPVATEDCFVSVADHDDRLVAHRNHGGSQAVKDSP
jgi:hypothetical protein